MKNYLHIVILIIVSIISFYLFLNYIDKEHFNDNSIDLNEKIENIKTLKQLEQYNQNKSIESIKPIQEEPIQEEPIQDSNKLVIKKTNKYNLVVKSDTFCVWEPEPIDDFYPLGQLITLDKNPPNKECLLVKSDNIPQKYTLITQFKQFGIWKPESKDTDYHYMSYIFSKEKPSLNKIRGIHKQYSEESSIDTVKVSFKNKQDRLYSILSIHDSDYFVVNDKKNKEKIDKVYTLNLDLTIPQKKLMVKNTKTYDKIWSNTNQQNKQHISVWRPVADTNYKILGDIILNNEQDPNNNLETPTVHKSQTNPVLFFDSEPILYQDKDKDNNNNNNNKNNNNNNNNNKIQFWKPKSKTGYITLGDIVTIDGIEPKNDIMATIPLEYTTQNNDIETIWNSFPETTHCAAWSNNNFCNVFGHLSKPNTPLYKLDDNYIKNEVDNYDTKQKIILKFNPKTVSIKQSIIKNAIKNKLASKFDISPSRIEILKYDKNNKEIIIELKQRPYNSEEEVTEKVFKELAEQIYIKHIQIKHNGILLMIIDNVSVIHSDNPNIKLDNSLFLNAVK